MSVLVPAPAAVWRDVDVVGPGSAMCHKGEFIQEAAKKQRRSIASGE